MNRLSEERVIGLLREVAKDIPPDAPSSLTQRALAGGTDSFFKADSPLGVVYVAAGSDGVRHVAPAASPEEFARAHRERFGRLVSPADEELVAALAGRVERALAGERVEVPLDLSGTTPFQRRVMEVVSGIPRGEVRPYVWVAREAGPGGFEGRRERDGREPGAAAGAVSPRRAQRRQDRQLRLRSGGEGEAPGRGGRLAAGARQGAVRGDPYDRDRMSRHLPKREADTARKPPPFPRGGSGDLRRVPAVQGVPSGGRVKPGSVGEEG